jgi:hypothetical protein
LSTPVCNGGLHEREETLTSDELFGIVTQRFGGGADDLGEHRLHVVIIHAVQQLFGMLGHFGEGDLREFDELTLGEQVTRRRATGKAFAEAVGDAR